MNSAKFLPVSVGAFTETGKREENQDNMSGFLSPFGSVYIVADGMGGHKGGAEASRMVVEGFRKHLTVLPASTPIADALSLAARLTNVELLEKAGSGDPNLSGMGSTVAIAVIRGTDRGMEVITGHAGDSRVYRHRGGQLVQLTHDHTQVQWMIDRNMLDEEGARKHPDASVLTRAMGHTTELAIDVSQPIPLADGDELLMCSDGLSGFVNSDEINRVLNQYHDPAVCARELVRLALSAGSNDNITVQCLRIGNAPPAVPAAPPSRLTMPDSSLAKQEQRNYVPPVPMPLQPQHPAAPPPSAPARGRSASTLFLAGLAAGIVVAAGAYLFYRSGLFLKLFPGRQEAQVALRLEGSTTIGQELAPALLKAFAEKEGGKVTEKTPVNGLSRLLEVQFKDKPPILFSVRANGSEHGFSALEHKTADIAMSSKQIGDTETKSLAAIGAMRSPECEHLIAMDGIAVIVNVGNPVKSLIIPQIAAIFAGETTDWGKVGGEKGKRINVYTRDQQSGTYAHFKDVVLGKKSPSKDSVVKATADEVAAAVGSDPQGIGYVGMGQINSSSVPALAVGASANALPLRPTMNTVSDATYVLTRPLYFYTPQAASDTAKRFLAFIASAEGQEVVKRVGFVMPASIARDQDFEQGKESPSWPARFTQSVAKKQKLRAAIEFSSQSANLDAKATGVLEGVLPKLAGKTGVLVIGFSDDKEACTKEHLGDKRAQAVQKQLKDRSIEAQTGSFCAEVPTADNNTEAGRAKNRRVEIWVDR